MDNQNDQNDQDEVQSAINSAYEVLLKTLEPFGIDGATLIIDLESGNEIVVCTTLDQEDFLEQLKDAEATQTMTKH